MSKKDKLDVLYVGTLCSEKLINKILDENLGLPNLAAQKYHRLLAEGMAFNKDLFAITVLSVPEYTKPIQNEIIVSTPKDISNGVEYNYIPIIFLPLLKRIGVILWLFYEIGRWRFSRSRGRKILIFDILNFNISILSVIASNFFRLKIVAVVTDLPKMMYVLQEKLSFFNKLTYKVQNFLLQRCYGYVFLTHEMNNIVNKKMKPYCIIEGLADHKLIDPHYTAPSTSSIRIFHYSGGLYEKFGVKMLVDAFMALNDKNTRLHLFGNGDLIDYINTCQRKDSRIIFFGYKNNEVVLRDQQNAFVLVNPRFSDGDYNKYSFPSKTIEYMSSGIPLLTTKLKGIPAEYFDFVYFFQNETIEGYRDTMVEMLCKSSHELTDFGFKARSFILSKKNNIIQSTIFYNTFCSNCA